MFCTVEKALKHFLDFFSNRLHNHRLTLLPSTKFHCSLSNSREPHTSWRNCLKCAMSQKRGQKHVEPDPLCFLPPWASRHSSFSHLFLPHAQPPHLPSAPPHSLFMSARIPSCQNRCSTTNRTTALIKELSPSSSIYFHDNRRWQEKENNRGRNEWLRLPSFWPLVAFGKLWTHKTEP